MSMMDLMFDYRCIQPSKNTPSIYSKSGVLPFHSILLTAPPSASHYTSTFTSLRYCTMSITISRLAFIAVIIIALLGQALSCIVPGGRCDSDRLGCCGWYRGSHTCRTARKFLKRVYKCQPCQKRTETCGDDSDCCYEHACRKACPTCKKRCWKGCMQSKENCRENKDCCTGHQCMRDGLAAPKRCHSCRPHFTRCNPGGVPCCFGRKCKRVDNVDQCV